MREREEGFDAGLHRAQLWRRARRWVLVLCVLVVVVEHVGAPALRVTYQQRAGGRVVAATYLSVTGMRRAVAGQFEAGTCPLFVMLPLERSLWSYGKDAARRLVQSLET